MDAMLDTSVLVRYLTGDPPRMAQEAMRIIESESTLVVTGIVLVETAHVLATVYHAARVDLVDTLVAFLRRANITVLGMTKEVVIEALLLCRPSGRVSFPDALVWASARSAEIKTLYTFDRRFPSDRLEVRFRAPVAR